MRQRYVFLRKVAYVVAMVVLLLPLSWLGAPAAKGSRQASPGGLLARMRAQHQLSQATLGQIDPASETIKLATLGMRGIAANILWEKANYYKKTEDWTNLSATLEQIVKLQPNFISVWRFQAWNLSYNVSAEFDDYRDRYYWVIRGINFLKEGEAYNRDEPRILWDLGWFISQKIGRSDERKYFRRLFKKDDDFHPPDRLPAERDNWLVGKHWFRQAERAVDDKWKPLRVHGKGKSDLIFYVDAPMCQIDYAEAIEQEGVHGDLARLAWRQAERDWIDDYGNRPLQRPGGYAVSLNELEDVEKKASQAVEKLDQLLPGLRETMRAQRQADLSDEQRRAVEIPANERSEQEQKLAADAQQWLAVSHEDLAEQIRARAPDEAAEATSLVLAARKAEHRAHQIRQYREIVNFNYWRLRCKMEQTSEALAAREQIYQGDQRWQDADLVEARKQYEQAFGNWRAVLDKFPSIVDDAATGDDLLDVIKRYRRILDEMDEPFPKDFVLRDIIEVHDQEGALRDVLIQDDES